MLVLAIAGLLLAPVEAEPAPVELMVLTEVNCDSAKAGDRVKLRVNHALTLADGTPVPVGTPATGEVVSLSHSGFVLHRGSLAVRVLRINLPDRAVPLVGDYSTVGHGGKNDDQFQVAFAPMYAPFARGHSAKFKAGEVLVAHLAPAQPTP